MRNRLKTPKRRGLFNRMRALLFLKLSGIGYRLAPGVISGWFRRWFFSTKPYRLQHAQEALRGQARHLFIENKNNKISILEWGSGPVILLVHGWNGRALQMSHFIEPLLGCGFKVVAFDHKGHGESSSRYSSFLEMTEGTQLVMAHYAQDLSGIIAHSIGCNTVLKASEDARQDLKITLIAPVDDFLAWLEKVRMRIGIDARLFDHVIGMIEADTGLKLAEQCMLEESKISRHRLQLVHDKFDRINRIEASYKLQEKFPGTPLVETEALGHARILANPEVVAQVVRHVADKGELFNS